MQSSSATHCAAHLSSATPFLSKTRVADAPDVPQYASSCSMKCGAGVGAGGGVGIGGGVGKGAGGVVLPGDGCGLPLMVTVSKTKPLTFLMSSALDALSTVTLISVAS